MMHIKTQLGKIGISTVALPFAHGLDLYETMVFDEHDAELETERKFNRIQVLTWETCLLRTLSVYSRILQEI